MDVYSERLSRLVGHIPSDMLPSLPDVVVECIRLHAVQPGAALRNRSEAAFLRWMCSQIEISVAQKLRGKAPERKSLRPQEKPLERKSVYRTQGYEQKPNAPHVRYGHKETRGEETNGGNRNASHSHRNHKATLDVAGIDDHEKTLAFHVEKSPTESKDRKRGRKRDDERNGNGHVHLKHSKTVRDKNGQNWKCPASRISDDLSETEGFMDIDKTSRTHQSLPETKELKVNEKTGSNRNASCKHQNLKDTGDCTGVDNHQKSIPFPVGASPSETKERIKERKRVDEKDRNNHLHLGLKEMKKSSRMGDRNGKKWKRLPSYIYNSLTQTEDFMDKEIKKHQNAHEHYTRQMKTSEFTSESAKKNKEKSLPSHMHGETKERIRDRKNIHENNHAHLSGNKMQSERVRDENGRKWKWVAAQMNDSPSETDDYMEVDKISGNYQRLHEAYMCLEEIVEATEDENSSQRNHEIFSSESRDSLVDLKELTEKEEPDKNLEEAKALTIFENTNGINRSASPKRDNFKESIDLKGENINGRDHRLNESYVEDSRWEMGNLTGEGPAVERKDRKTQTHFRLKELQEYLEYEIKHENDWNFIESYMRNSLREITKLIRERKQTDKINVNGDIHDSFNETKDKTNGDKDIRTDQINGTHQKCSSSMHKSLKETAEMLERVDITAPCKADKGRDPKKQHGGPSKYKQLPEAHHGGENTLKRKRNKSPESHTKPVFTYMSLGDSEENGSASSFYGWTRPNTVSHQKKQEAKSPSRPSLSKKTTKTKDRKPKTEKTRLAYDQTKIKDKTRSSRKRVQFGAGV